MVSQLRRHQLILSALLLSAALALGIVDANASGSPASPGASMAKKCKSGKKGKSCRKRRSGKRGKSTIKITDCPSGDLTPGTPYTFTGRVSPARGGIVVRIDYYDQGSAPVAQHAATTKADGSFSDIYAYQATGVRRGGTVRAHFPSGTRLADPVCGVTIAEM